MSRTFVIATRGSRLALRQVELISDAIRTADPGVSLQVREIHTEGDRTQAPLSEIGGTGVFTKAIEDALLRGDGDIAVHSLKDLPTELAPGLSVAATPPRADVRDVLIARDGVALATLPPGARVGTGSGRRAVQLRALRPDVDACEIRGNVETRIGKVDSGEYDAAVLAMAGLSRLGLAGRATQVFEIDEMLPAVGQAAIGVEVRTDDAEARELIARIDDALTHAATDAERAFLRRLGGGCRLPVGAHAYVDGDRLRVRGMIAGDDGHVFTGVLDGDVAEAAAAGTALAENLLRRGAAAFVDA